MNLATVLAGQPTQEGGPIPVPMGTANLDYHGVTEDDLAQLGKALQDKGVPLPKPN